MRKAQTLGQKLRALKPCPGFVVTTEYDRQEVCRQAKTLMDDKAVPFIIVTRNIRPDVWLVGAIIHGDK